MELKITEKVDSIGIGGDVLIDSNETITYENGIDSGYSEGYEDGYSHCRKVIIPDRLTCLEEKLRCEIFCNSKGKVKHKEGYSSCDGSCNYDKELLDKVLDAIHLMFDDLINEE